MSEVDMERDETTPEGVRRQLLARIGAAGLLIVLLLGGLAVYDHLHRPGPPAPSPQAVTQNPVAAAEVSREGAAALAPSPAENAVADVVLRRDTPPEPELSAPPVVAPPGQRQPDALGENPGAPRLVLGGEPGAPTHPSAHGSKTKPGGAPMATQAEPVMAPAGEGRPVPPPGKGYLVQMGLFSQPENAAAQLARLESLGIPAHLETRVVVGPFPDRTAARAAQARLKAAGEAPGVIVPPRR